VKNSIIPSGKEPYGREKQRAKSIGRHRPVYRRVKARRRSDQFRKTAKTAAAAGADIIVTGNMLRKPGGKQRMKEIAKAVKW
jgi:hypothetical protein